MFYSKVILIGFLADDPETRYTPSGSPVTTFVLQINDDGSCDERGSAHTVEVITVDQDPLLLGESFTKGCCLLVEGRIRARRWKTVDGSRRSKLEIIAEHVSVLENKRSTTS
jgi:single-strand DNA-binding protein